MSRYGTKNSRHERNFDCIRIKSFIFTSHIVDRLKTGTTKSLVSKYVTKHKEKKNNCKDLKNMNWIDRILICRRAIEGIYIG